MFAREVFKLFGAPSPTRIILLAALAVATAGVESAGQEAPKSAEKQPNKQGPATESGGDDSVPTITDPSKRLPPVKKERRLWAASWRWAKAPEFVVEQWITDQPDTKGKYVLIEFWATWCGPCRRSIPLLNQFHEKFGKELVVIGVSEETAEDVKKMQRPKIFFNDAAATKKRMKDKLGVWGIPHVIILEPDGYVIWEGFPLQEDFELTDEISRRSSTSAASCGPGRPVRISRPRTERAADNSDGSMISSFTGRVSQRRRRLRRQPTVMARPPSRDQMIRVVGSGMGACVSTRSSRIT